MSTNSQSEVASTSTSNSMESHCCTVCKEVINDSRSRSVSCTRCQAWSHVKCTMGKEVFDLLSKISNNPKKLVSSGVLAYLCVNCEGSICMIANSSSEAQTSPPASPTVVSALKQDEVIPPRNEAAPANVVSTENDELHKMEKRFVPSIDLETAVMVVVGKTL